MTAKLGVMVIHGMGDQKRDFADKAISQISSQLGENAGGVVFSTCYWAPIPSKIPG